jgi:hypothetical protein
MDEAYADHPCPSSIAALYFWLPFAPAAIAVCH